MIKQLTIATILFPLFLYAQERIMLSGNITNDSISVENIHVLNKTSNQGTICNKHGNFKIPGKTNDTIIISGIQFYYKEILITKKQYLNRVIRIELLQKTNNLEEIEIKSHNLSGSLSIDADNVKKPISKIEKGALDFSMIDFSIPVVGDIDKIDRIKPPDISHLVNPMAPGISAGVSLRKFTTKEDRKLKILKNNDTASTKIRNLFTDDFFTLTLKIPKEKIDAFINHCKSKGILGKKKIEMIDFLIKESKSYKK